MLKFNTQNFSSVPFNDGAPARKLEAATRAVIEPMEARLLYSASPAVNSNHQVTAITAQYETQALPDSGEAGSDPSIWVNPTNSAKSAVIGTDKLGSINVYDVTGNLIQSIANGDYFNVDNRSGFSLGGKSVSVVAADRVDTNSLVLFTIDPSTRKLTDVTASTIKLSSGGTVDGVAMYQNADNGNTYVFVSSSKGVIEQFLLSDNGKGKIAAKSVRTINVGGTAEGMTADDANGALYVSEDGQAIWKYGAEPTDGSVRSQIDAYVNGQVGTDTESLGLYTNADGSGYLIAARQNTNDYVVYDRQTGAYITTFKVTAGSNGVDDVSSSDGIAITSADLGNGLTGGAFVAEDDKNAGGNQDYKIISWADIANAQSYPLSIDGAQSSDDSGTITNAASTAKTSTSTSLSVTSLSLYQASTSNKLATIKNGATIDLADYDGLDLNVQADTKGTIGSVQFDVNGVTNAHTDNYSPYNIAGTDGVWTPTIGSNTITATAYSAHNNKGTASAAYTVSFHVMDSSSGTGDSSDSNTSKPANIKSITATANSSTQVTVAWKPGDDNADGFQIERSTDGGKTFKKVATTTATSYVDTSVTANSSYSYRVTAYNSIGNSAVSSVVSATVPKGSSTATTTVSAPSSRPSATNTGVKAGTKLTTVDGFTAKSNTTYSNLYITGEVVMTGLTNITLTNCVIDGGDSTMWGVRTDRASNITIKNCEFVGQTSCAVYGDGFTAIANYVHQGGGDGFKPISNCVIQGNYVTQLGWNSPDAHADGVQIRGGTNNVIVGNYFDMPINVANTKSNSALFIQLDTTDVTFDSNWIRGGNYAIHAYSDSANGDQTLKITNNTFYTASAQFGFGQVGLEVVWTGNVTDLGVVATTIH